jgi:hypothetical protein
MDDITILKNRLAYFSNRVSYKSDFEEIDFKIDYEIENETYDDEIKEEDYIIYQTERENVNKIKELIKNGQIDITKDTVKSLSKLSEIPLKEVKKLFTKYYDEFEEVQKKL